MNNSCICGHPVETHTGHNGDPRCLLKDCGCSAYSKTFVVWRRQPDGLVGASTYRPEDWTTNGQTVTFDILLITEDWLEAANLIKDEQHNG